MMSEHDDTDSNQTTNRDEPVVKLIPISAIRKPGWKTRSTDTEHVQELQESIGEVGLLQPVIVLQEGDQYVLLAGNNRFEAEKGRGSTEILAVVRQGLDSRQAEAVGLVENLRRKQLAGAELTEAQNRLLELRTRQMASTSADKPKSTRGAQARVAKELKVSKSKLSRSKTRERHAAPEVMQALREKRLGQAQVDALCELSAVEQVDVLPQVVDKTFRETRLVVDEIIRPGVTLKKKFLVPCRALRVALADEDLGALSNADRAEVEAELRAVRDLLDGHLSEVRVGGVAVTAEVAPVVPLTPKGNRRRLIIQDEPAGTDEAAA